MYFYHLHGVWHAHLFCLLYILFFLMYGLWTGHMGVDAFLHSGMIDTTFFVFISFHLIMGFVYIQK